MCSMAGTALMFERLNREERGLVERRLPRDAPSRRLIAVTEAARSGKGSGVVSDLSAVS